MLTILSHVKCKDNKYINFSVSLKTYMHTINLMPFLSVSHLEENLCLFQYIITVFELRKVKKNKSIFLKEHILLMAS